MMKKSKKQKINMSYNRPSEELDNITEDTARAVSENFKEEQDANVDGNNGDDPNEEPETDQEQIIAGLEKQIASMDDKYKRLMAEFDNFRKRTVKEKAEIIKNGSADVITDILPVIDDLERAMANSTESNDFTALKEGVELIYSKLMHTLEQKGLQKISPKNEPFDTDFHEAIAMIPSTNEETKGMVIDCIIDGYRLNDKVLRHAKVAVAQ
ncbi:MAG: nucleotide exchange factor GrpE [Bacteroidaceae bacterium]|nr:nucleotide exchange factor GrpE [Bacteroidaceae bacterium]